MATISSYDTVGVKEDVSDVISNIAPTATPFQSGIGADTSRQKLYEWQEDTLMNVASNPMAEGAPAPAASANATVMRSNTTQIFSKTASVTGSMQNTETYGRGKELAYQLGLRSKELKRDREWAFIGTGQDLASGSDGVARTMAGYQKMVDASMVYTAGTGGGLNFTGTVPARAALTEAMILALQQALYAGGADPSTLMVKPSDSTVVSGFSQSGRTVFVENGDTTLNNNITIYKSPFGTLKVVMNRFIRGTGATGTADTTSDALMYDPAQWKVVTFRNWFRQTLSITGDATNVQLLGEFGLKHMNYKASGLITNLT